MRFYPILSPVSEGELRGNKKIVLSISFYWHSSVEAHGESWGCTPEQKLALDALYTKKIELADEILVVNVGGYIGESTRNEIEYAHKFGQADSI